MLDRLATRYISKVYNTWKKEGLAGLSVRLLNPKTSHKTDSYFSEFSLPCNVAGQNDLHKQVLEEILTELNPSLPTRLSSTIFIYPFPDTKAPSSRDAILFRSTSDLVEFLEESGMCGIGKSTILLPSFTCLGLPEIKELPINQKFVVDSSQGINEYVNPDIIRWLISIDVLRFEDLQSNQILGKNKFQAWDRICLSLPETQERHSRFLSLGRKDFQVFKGILKTPGWIGCAQSYALIASLSQRQKAAPILVCEDDVEFSKDFDSKIKIVEDYLSLNEWDVFCGLLSDLSLAVQIDKVVRYQGIDFVHLGYSMGMVCNFYNERALNHLSKWDPNFTNIEENTIDVWLAKLPELKVITTAPFLVGHRNSASSSIFGFSNQRYSPMISSSERRLREIVESKLDD